ncbi:PID-CTERM protein-sorting domain-containing protein [Lutibacter sp.]|uniref:PID-CTERM protein-sorting domain-containing protein n=1 Tax=Lutibacter sp. TaxID=1925666 RepID=UPI0025BD635C|nr:hypothetical protein [Lutibacter sp.]
MSCFFVSFAQKNDVPVPGTNDDPPPPVGLPIDGGLSYLFIAGIAYGVYELKRKK